MTELSPTALELPDDPAGLDDDRAGRLADGGLGEQKLPGAADLKVDRLPLRRRRRSRRRRSRLFVRKAVNKPSISLRLQQGLSTRVAAVSRRASSPQAPRHPPRCPRRSPRRSLSSTCGCRPPWRRQKSAGESRSPPARRSAWPRALREPFGRFERRREAAKGQVKAAKEQGKAVKGQGKGSERLVKGGERPRKGSVK